MQDAIRDLRDIGAGHIEVINITKTLILTLTPNPNPNPNPNR